MKGFFFFGVLGLSFAAHSACNYTIYDRMYRTPEQQKEFKCGLNFKCLEEVIKSSGDNLDEIETLADYSRDNNCRDEDRIAQLIKKTMEAPAQCDISLKPSDMVIDKSYFVSKALGDSDCSSASPAKLLKTCREDGSTGCRIQFDDSTKPDCSVEVTGKKALADSAEGRKEAICRKILDCQEQALFSDSNSPDDSAKKYDELSVLRTQHNCSSGIEESMEQDQSARQNHSKTDLPEIPSAGKSTPGSKAKGE